MDLTNDDFLRGAIATADMGLEVTGVAGGYIHPSLFNWYWVFDPDTGRGALAYPDDTGSDGEFMNASESFRWQGANDFIQRWLAMEHMPGLWFTVLNDDEGWAKAEFLDRELLRTEMEGAAKSENTEFDFEAWAKRSGFDDKPKRRAKKRLEAAEQDENEAEELNEREKNLENEQFLLGAIAAHEHRLQVEWVAIGAIVGMGSLAYSWYVVLDERTGQCAVVLWNDENGGELASSEVFKWTDKKDFTRRLLATLKFGGEEEPAMGWFVIMEADGAAVNPDWVDAETIRAHMEKEAAEIKTGFDFEAWAVRSGLKRKRKARRNK